MLLGDVQTGPPRATISNILQYYQNTLPGLRGSRALKDGNPIFRRTYCTYFVELSTVWFSCCRILYPEVRHLSFPTLNEERMPADAFWWRPSSFQERLKENEKRTKRGHLGTNKPVDLLCCSSTFCKSTNYSLHDIDDGLTPILPWRLDTKTTTFPFKDVKPCSGFSVLNLRSGFKISKRNSQRSKLWIIEAAHMFWAF